MADYIQKAQDNSFMDLLDDKDFRIDLVRFFSGGRYKYTKDEMREIGFEGLAKQFAEHMRSQSWNEVTALKDLNYANNPDVHRQGKESFGRLIQAWDGSESAGTGFGTAVGDFAEAVFTAPSTYAGFGVGKVAGKAAAKGTQIALRQRLKDALTKPLQSAVVRGAAGGAATEATIGAVQSYGAGQTREELIDGYEYTAKDLALDAAISGTVGGVFGAVGGAIGSRQQRSAANILENQKNLSKQATEEARTAAIKTIANASEEMKRAAASRAFDINTTLEAKAVGSKAGGLLDPLDEESVRRGDALLKGMSDPKAEGVFTSGLSVDTMRSITAASIQIAEELNIGPNERITSAVASALKKGDIRVTDRVDNIRKKFNLTKEQFSLIYLADVSRAGKILAEQSVIKRAQMGQLSESAMDRRLAESVAPDLATLASTGLSTISDTQAAEIAAQAVTNSTRRGVVGAVYKGAQELDQMRIAFMTSQVATTARNVTSTGLLAGTDIIDEFYRGMWRGLKATAKGDFNYKPGDVLMRMTSTLRGMTFNEDQAMVVKQMLKDEMPEQYASVFHDTLRMEVGTQSHTVFAKAGRAVNILNTATDTAFKEAAFFSSLDRQLRDKGTTVGEFLETSSSLDSLPEGVVRKAMDDANRFTMQRTFADDDTLTGKAARFASEANKKAPFIVSSVIGIPFPRYVANHLDMVADYTPGFPVITKSLEKSGFTGDVYKTNEDRLVRQFTAVSLMYAGYKWAEAKNGETSYTDLQENAQLMGIDLPSGDVSSSMGFMVAPMFYGDLLYRYQNDLPFPDLMDAADTVLAGMADMGADFTMITEVGKSIKEGRLTDELQKAIGNIAATFTYPATIARDVYGQFDYGAAGIPYVRDVKGEQPFSQDDDMSLKGEGSAFQTLVGQATRFLPDVDWIQYTQSFTRKEGQDLDYYDPFNPQPVGKINPLIKALTGVQEEPPKTGLQQEMTKLGLDGYKLYKNSTEDNASVDYVLRYRLSQTVSPAFEEWRQSAILGGQAGDLTYDQLTADAFDGDADKANKLKEQFLSSFVSTMIKEEKSLVNAWFNDLATNQPVQARGFIRNNYDLKRSELGKDAFNSAAEYLSDGAFRTAKEYLADSEDILEELRRRQSLMGTASSIKNKTQFEVVQ